ncbi:MAG TPA: HD domain-containing protein [Salinimicrobium catena]|uniref:HD domain-containing protein n=1 Tax=Salinimicrobium catena TaxID=390640 RepID=A0A7C2M611_9FLAO|nr:HD domain-containing protein [Salinimicrobium catena]
MDQDQVLKNTRRFVKQTLQNAEGGHDWFHIQRVVKNASQIASGEDVDRFIVELGALLHDIADSKFHNGDETVGPTIARRFLENQQVPGDIINHVVKIIENISFKGGNIEQEFTSPELEVIQDADRLDALGAIGIARTFNYGGHKGRPLYDPAIKPNLNMSKEEYKASTAPTVNHFYEKLFLLKDRMNTQTGRKIAERRHQFMELFLEEFYNEWGLNPDEEV